MNNQIIKIGVLLFFVVSLTLGLSFALQSILAAPSWDNPACPPPGCNVPAPVNYGSSTAATTIHQATWSNLDVGAILTASSSAQVVNSFGVTTNGGPFLVSGTFGSEGNVGIGTLNPGAKLDIDMTNLTATEGLRISRDAAASHYAYLNILNESGNTIFMVKEDGNVGIGTNIPGAKLDINGTLKISGGNPGQGKVLMSDAAGLASWVATSSLGISGGVGAGGGLSIVSNTYSGCGYLASCSQNAVCPGTSKVVGGGCEILNEGCDGQECTDLKSSFASADNTWRCTIASRAGATNFKTYAICSDGGSGGGSQDVRFWQNVGPSYGADNQDHTTSCDDGYLTSGLKIFTSNGLDGEMTSHCTKSSLTLSGSTIKTGPGIGADNQFHNVNCDAGQVIKSITIQAIANLDGNIRLDCRTLNGSTMDDANPVWAARSFAGPNNDITTYPMTYDNQIYAADCPTGYIAAGVRFWAGGSLEQFDVMCKKVDGLGNGGGAETDPTVQANVKDGVLWSEITGTCPCGTCWEVRCNGQVETCTPAGWKQTGSGINICY